MSSHWEEPEVLMPPPLRIKTEEGTDSLEQTTPTMFIKTEEDLDLEEQVLTLPMVSIRTKEVTESLLPQQSRELYNEAYQKFTNWKTESGVGAVTTEDVLLAYFRDFIEKYKPTTAWPEYSKLKTTIRMYENILIEDYKRLSAFLSNNACGHKAKQAKACTHGEIDALFPKTSKTISFTNEEKILLVRLVKENVEVENKKTDALTVAEKNRAWERITTSFNSQPDTDTPRTMEQLRKLWANLKHRKRKEITALRHKMLTTRDGQARNTTIDPVVEFVSLATPSMNVAVDSPCDNTPTYETDETPCTLPSTNHSTDESLFGTEKSAVRTPSVVGHDPLSVSATSSTKGGISTKRSEEQLTDDRSIDASRMQQELHHVKMQIAEEELLKAQQERERSEERDQLMKEILKLQLRKAAVEAKLASLKLKQFQLQKW